MKIERKANSSPGSLQGECNPEQFQTLIKTTTTTDHLQSKTDLPKSESTGESDNGNDHIHEFPILSPLPISFLPSELFIPPVGICFDMVDPFASLSKASEKHRAFQDRLRKRYNSSAYAGTNNNNNNNKDIGIILFGFPLVPAEDNDHKWIRSKNEKLLPPDSNTDSSSDDETTGAEDGDSDDDSWQMTTRDDDDDELEFDDL